MFDNNLYISTSNLYDNLLINLRLFSLKQKVIISRVRYKLLFASVIIITGVTRRVKVYKL